MPRAFGFKFATPLGVVAFLVLLVVFILVYHQVLQTAIRHHPEATLRAAQEHCRYLLGQQLGQMPESALAAELARCNDLRIKSVDVAGGVLDPVVVRITLEAQPRPPLGKDVLIFKSVDAATGNLHLLASLSRLLSGRWEFNHYTTYSSTTFHGSF